MKELIDVCDDCYNSIKGERMARRVENPAIKECWICGQKTESGIDIKIRNGDQDYYDDLRRQP